MILRNHNKYTDLLLPHLSISLLIGSIIKKWFLGLSILKAVYLLNIFVNDFRKICDTEDWSIDAGKFSFDHRNKLHLNYQSYFTIV